MQHLNEGQKVILTALKRGKHKLLREGGADMVIAQAGASELRMSNPERYTLNTGMSSMSLAEVDVADLLKRGLLAEGEPFVIDYTQGKWRKLLGCVVDGNGKPVTSEKWRQWYLTDTGAAIAADLLESGAVAW